MVLLSLLVYSLGLNCVLFASEYALKEASSAFLCKLSHNGVFVLLL